MSAANHQNVPTIWNKGSSSKLRDDREEDDSSSSDDEPQARMRVGDMYQAHVPQWTEGSSSEKLPHSKEGMLIWSPTTMLTEENLDSFCQMANEKHSYNTEQALGMLFWHKHDIKKSLADMQNFTPMPDEWSMEDKVLFEQAYTYHGKNFRKIQQLIPDKEISQLVKHYYVWKKNRVKTSLMDKQAAKRPHDNDSEDSPADEDERGSTETEQTPPPKVANQEDEAQCKYKLPKGIQLSAEDFEVFSSHEKGAEGHLESLHNQLVDLKRQVQTSKQQCGKLTAKMTPIKEPPKNAGKVSGTWTDKETNLLLEGIKYYGENYDAISEIIGTKTVQHIKAIIEARKSELKIDEILQNRAIKDEELNVVE